MTKRRKTLDGGASTSAPAGEHPPTRLAADKKRIVEEGLTMMRALVESQTALAARGGVTDLRAMGDGVVGTEDVAGALARIAAAERRCEVDCNVMDNFLSSHGSKIKTRKWRYTLDVPMVDVAMAHELLREPVGEYERPCSEGDACCTLLIKGAEPGWVARELVLGEQEGTPTEPPGPCMLCHDAIVSEFILHHTTDDPQNDFNAGPGEAGEAHAFGHPVTVNKVQYLFGAPGGYRSDLLAVGKEFKPIPGVVGLVPVFSLEYFQWYVDDAGVRRLDDRVRHFQAASALL